MADTLPPLPVKHVVVDGLWEEVRGPYTADEVEEIRAQAVAEAVAEERERCAKLCDELETSAWRIYKNGGAANQHTEGRSDGAGECAAAIRSQPPRAGQGEPT